MSKLDDLIRTRGCDDLTAIHWLKEERAVLWYDGHRWTVEPNRSLVLNVPRGHGASLSAAVVDYLTNETPL